MKIAIIAFSSCGATLAEKIMAALFEHGHNTSGHIAKRHANYSAFEPFTSVYALTAHLFGCNDALVFVGACGIAVRAIAPVIKSKLTDPAVVVCDETGQFSISLLSGHAGGANCLAAQIAKIINATPVITTASDAHNMLNPISQAKDLVLGIGCRRGLAAEVIARAVTIMLWDNKIPLLRICKAATIDVKQNEEGLLWFAKTHKLPLNFFSAKELSGVLGDFSSSERVLQAVGVDNVCERAATLCGKNGQLILRKTAKDGVTIAVFRKD